MTQSMPSASLKQTWLGNAQVPNECQYRVSPSRDGFICL